MSRYIDIDEEIEKIKRRIEHQQYRIEEYRKNGFWDWSKGIKNAQDAIGGFYGDIEYLNSIPMADVRPNVHGKWIKDDCYDKRDNFYHCSECGRVINIICGEDLSDYPFCHCGADMGKEAEE